MQHILRADQFTRQQVDEILSRAKTMQTLLPRNALDIARGHILAALFYEPSTRTRLSFETAMLRLGGQTISETDVQFSSATKGEVLPDTIRIVSGYADIIAIRSKHKGDAELAAQYATVPILNAGDGPGEHPTQSLIDLYTISEHFALGKETVRVTMVGDLKYGRTVHSLTKMLRLFENVAITFVAPEVLAMPSELVQEGDNTATELSDDILGASDVIYDTRVQKERFDDLAEYERLKSAYVFDTEKVSKMHEEAILLHPLPRITEITPEVDELPQARYFEQARNGVPIRMALITKLLGIRI